MSRAGWAMTPDLVQWMTAKCGPLPGEGAAIWERPARFFSKFNFPAGTAAGTTIPTQIEFFTDARAEFLCNLDQPNQIPNNSGFAMHSIRIGWCYGYDHLLRALGQSAPTAAQKQLASLIGGQFTAAASLAASINHVQQAMEMTRQLFEGANVQFIVKNNEVFTMTGLGTFPNGKGSPLIMPAHAMATNSATAGEVTSSMLQMSNGVPVYQNRFSFGTPYPMPGGQTFRLIINLPRQINFADTDIGPLASETATAGLIAGCLTVELEGDYATPQ